eukprot:Gb_09249 [translate_table: standard]
MPHHKIPGSQHSLAALVRSRWFFLLWISSPTLCYTRQRAPFAHTDSWSPTPDFTKVLGELHNLHNSGATFGILLCVSQSLALINDNGHFNVTTSISRFAPRIFPLLLNNNDSKSLCSIQLVPLHLALLVPSSPYVLLCALNYLCISFNKFVDLGLFHTKDKLAVLIVKKKLFVLSDQIFIDEDPTRIQVEELGKSQV